MIKAISTFPSPQVRAYFRPFMGGNQFKKVRSRPLKSRRGKKTYAKDCGVCSSFVPVCSKKLEQDFSVFTCGFARFAKSCSNSVFRIGTGFFRVYLRFCSFVPIVPVFNKFIYMNTYIDPFLYFFLSCDKLKIIGTNGTFTRNAW